jgi:hypothetical protein
MKNVFLYHSWLSFLVIILGNAELAKTVREVLDEVIDSSQE